MGCIDHVASGEVGPIDPSQMREGRNEAELVGSGGGVVEGTLPIEVVLVLYGGEGVLVCVYVVVYKYGVRV